MTARLPYLLSLVVAATGCAGVVRGNPAAEHPLTLGRPSITIETPASGAVSIIRFRTENVIIASPFLAPDALSGPLPRAHLHVTVDGAAWHWVHASPDPVVITPLSPGEHTVTLELAGADHRPLAVRSVRFNVAGKTSAAGAHDGHR